MTNSGWRWKSTEIAPHLDAMQSSFDEILMETGRQFKVCRNTQGDVRHVGTAINLNTKSQFEAYQNALSAVIYQTQEAKLVMMRDLERLQARIGPAPQMQDMPMPGMSQPGMMPTSMPMSGAPPSTNMQQQPPLGAMDIAMSDAPMGTPVMASNTTMVGNQMPQNLPGTIMGGPPPLHGTAPMAMSSTAPFPSMDDDESLVMLQSPTVTSIKAESPALSKRDSSQPSPRPGSTTPASAKGKLNKGSGATMLGQVHSQGQGPLGASNFTNMQFTIASPAQGNMTGPGGSAPQGMMRRPGMSENAAQQLGMGQAQDMGGLGALDSVPTANMGGEFGGMDVDMSMFGADMQQQQPGQFDDPFFHVG